MKTCSKYPKHQWTETLGRCSIKAGDSYISEHKLPFGSLAPSKRTFDASSNMPPLGMFYNFHQKDKRTREMDTPQNKSRLLKSPALIFLIVALSVFVSEASVMLLLYYLPRLSVITEAIFDASLVVALISPTLYFFLFRPMVIHISEREKIEEILHKNEEEQFKVMIRTSLDAFLITDIQGRILEVNDAYCHMLGYGREELMSMNTADIAVAETQEETARHMRILLRTGSDRCESHKRRKDGHIQIVEESSNYSNLYGGRIYCFLRDITERKQAEEHRDQLLTGA